MSFLDRIAECNNADLSRYRPFIVGAHRVGWVDDHLADLVAPFGDVFRVTVDAVTLNPDLDDIERRTAAMDRVLRELAEAGVVGGWRDEPYAVKTTYAATPLMRMERAAVPLFGVRAYGVHMNGYVRDGGGIKMWIGRRAADKPTYPNKLDNMVAGGQPDGISLVDNLVKEAAEEASLPDEMVRGSAVPVGAVTYCAAVPEGLKPDVQFCFDLELPPDIRPRNADGEIAEFQLWAIDDVLETVAETDAFKFNCNLVIIDFAIRHGCISPDHADYVAIVRGLRQ